VGGFLLPGNHADVLLTTSGSGPNDSTGGGATTTLLQNIKVMAVAQRLDAPDSNKVDPAEVTTVTLLVTPDQAAKLDLGMNKGTLHLSLRNPGDKAEADTRPATMAQLRFHQEPPAIHSSEVETAGHEGELATFVAAKANTDEPDEVRAMKPAMKKPAVGRRGAQIYTLRGTQRGSINLD
jgi:Flp pilus assembly protein CpaB